MKMLRSLKSATAPHRSPEPIAAPGVPGDLHYRCNVCGAASILSLPEMERESSACTACGATLRFRSLIGALCERLYGSPTALPDVAADCGIVGIGMSDAPCYAERLAEKFDYSNTFYHCEPHLDITAPSPRWLGACDFIITSDVFEHVAPPVQRAFDNLRALLKPGGVVVFSVPFSLEDDTREHYPDLQDFTIAQESGEWVLLNRTSGGEQQVFRDLVFHGGPGSTLEMRLFSLQAIRRHFEAAGFVDVKVHDRPDFAHGIYWPYPWSVTMSARLPR